MTTSEARRASWWAVAPTLAGVLAVVVWAAGWRGADWPAQIFRIETFRHDGFTVWNNHWYGGHHSLGYSVLVPWLGAVVGPWSLGVAATVISTATVQALILRVRQRTSPLLAPVAASVFGLGLVANLAVGRLTFLVGLAVALGAVWAWSAAPMALAVFLAVLTSLTSPVAALILALVAVGVAAPSWQRPADLWALEGRGGQGPLLAAAAMVPVLVIAVVFPSGGSFPFAAGGLALALLVAGGTFATTRSTDVEVRAVVGLSTLAVVAAFVLPTPLGGNIARLPMFLAGPVALVLGWRSHEVLPRLAGVAVAVTALVWAWVPASDAVLRAPDDPTVDAAFFAPMVDAVLDDAGEVVRVEIPFTRRHWEAAHVAPVLPLARGWERQQDRRANPEFYDDEGLTSLDYQLWLQDNAVRYVALPHVELDPSAAAEAELLERGQPFLRPVWDDEHWKVWEVLNGRSLVGGDAELVELTSDRVVMDVAEAGEVVLRIRYSPHWVVDGESCVAEDPEGWVLLRASSSGRHELTISPSALASLGGAADPCEE